MEKHHVLIDSDLYEQHVDKTFNFQKKKKKKKINARNKQKLDWCTHVTVIVPINNLSTHLKFMITDVGFSICFFELI